MADERGTRPGAQPVLVEDVLGDGVGLDVEVCDAVTIALMSFVTVVELAVVLQAPTPQ